MRTKAFCVLIAVMGIVPSLTLAQDSKPSKFMFHGYIKDMQTVWVDTGNHWLTDNLIHNRLNFAWYPRDGLSLILESRNRLLFGEFVRMIPDYGDILENDRGWADMSWTISSGPSYVLHSYIDRAYVDYNKGKWQATLGRQRINWGMNLIWNPNDLFNAFSFFDFDYEERPGTDAARVQYYTGPASVADLVFSGGDSIEEMGFAGRYVANWKGYDIQVIGAYVKSDQVIGLGWAGDIKGAGFRGEGTAFLPTEDAIDSTATYVASISADYSFSKGLFIHGGFLYNSRGKTGHAGGTNQILNANLSAKMLSPARWSIFLQASRPITPLISISAAAIINPLDHSSFMGPSFTFSLADEVDVLFSSQIFLGQDGTEFGDYGSLWFLRMRWSF